MTDSDWKKPRFHVEGHTSTSGPRWRVYDNALGKTFMDGFLNQQGARLLCEKLNEYMKQPSPAWPEGLVEQVREARDWLVDGFICCDRCGHEQPTKDVDTVFALDAVMAAMQPVDPLDECETAALKYVRDCGGGEKEILGAETAIREYRRELAKRGLQLAETTPQKGA